MNVAELVLLVEDQHDTRNWLASIAKQAFPSIQVLSASDLRTARQALSCHARFRLVLVDLGLPDGSGSDLIRELASSHPDSPVVVTTVYSDDESLFGAIAAGAQGYLLKSQPAELLVRHLQRFDEGIPFGSTALPAVERYFAGGDTATRGYQPDELKTEVIRSGVSPLGGQSKGGDTALGPNGLPLSPQGPKKHIPLDDLLN